MSCSCSRGGGCSCAGRCGQGSDCGSGGTSWEGPWGARWDAARGPAVSRSANSGEAGIAPSGDWGPALRPGRKPGSRPAMASWSADLGHQQPAGSSRGLTAAGSGIAAGWSGASAVPPTAVTDGSAPHKPLASHAIQQRVRWPLLQQPSAHGAASRPSQWTRVESWRGVAAEPGGALQGTGPSDQAAVRSGDPSTDVTGRSWPGADRASGPPDDRSPLNYLFGTYGGNSPFDCCVNCGICMESSQEINQAANWICQSYCARNNGSGGVALLVDCVQCKVECMCIDGTGPIT